MISNFESKRLPPNIQTIAIYKYEKSLSEGGFKPLRQGIFAPKSQKTAYKRKKDCDIVSIP